MKDMWKKMTGKIVKVSYYRRGGVETEGGGLYLISLQEPSEVDSIPEGTAVSFEGGHPGSGRGVAQSIKMEDNINRGGVVLTQEMIEEAFKRCKERGGKA